MVIMILRLTFGVLIQMTDKISRNPIALGVSVQAYGKENIKVSHI